MSEEKRDFVFPQRSINLFRMSLLEMKKLKDEHDDHLRKAQYALERHEKWLEGILKNMFEPLNEHGLVRRWEDLCYHDDGWECEARDNPLPCCIYNEAEDPVLDECLFCFMPMERK